MRPLHQIWPGRNRFCCKRCITGPCDDFCPNYCVYLSILVVVVPYCVFVIPTIWNTNQAIVILFLLCVLITLLFLLLTSCTDPGIIPRKSLVQKFIEGPRKVALLFPSQPESNANRLCSTCHILRPPRASHCRVCDNCVLVFDHHCPFVNNCIGKRNYRYFMMFLVSVFVTSGLLVANLIVYGVARAAGSVDGTVITIISIVAACVIGLPLLGFLSFHLYLTITGKTTRELLKKQSNQIQDEQNQWFNVDPPLIDYFMLLPEEASVSIVQGFKTVDSALVT